MPLNPEGLPRGLACTMLLHQQVDNAIELGIAGAKTPGQKVSATLGDRLAVGEHVELTGCARRTDGVNAEVVLDEGHETRDLGAVVRSSGAMDDFDLHCVLRSYFCSHPRNSRLFVARRGL